LTYYCAEKCSDRFWVWVRSPRRTLHCYQ